MKVVRVLLIITVAAALLWLFTGCGARQARIVRPDGKEVMCETYNVTSEGAIDCGNAADRQQLVAFCTVSMEHAKLEMCKSVGADRAPSDSPKALYNKHIPVSVTRQRYNQEYFPGVWWY